MKNLTDMALTLAQDSGAEFADVRIQERRENTVYVSRRTLKGIDDSERFGFAVRVLKNGNWGFASGTRLDADTLASATKQALATADASAIACVAASSESERRERSRCLPNFVIPVPTMNALAMLVLLGLLPVVRARHLVMDSHGPMAESRWQGGSRLRAGFERPNLNTRLDY